MQKKLIVFLVFIILSLTTQLSAMQPDIIDLTNKVENTSAVKRKVPPLNTQSDDKKIKTGMSKIDCPPLSTILYTAFQKKKNNEIDAREFHAIKANVLEKIQEQLVNKKLHYNEVFDMPELPREIAHFLFDEASKVIPRIYYLTCLQKENFPTPTHYSLHVIHVSNLLINSLTKTNAQFSSGENKILQSLPAPLLYSVLFNARSISPLYIDEFVKNKIRFLQDAKDTDEVKKFEFMQKHFLANSQEPWEIETPDLKTKILITLLFPFWKNQEIFFFKNYQRPVSPSSPISTSFPLPTNNSVPSFASLLSSLSNNPPSSFFSARDLNTIAFRRTENTVEASIPLPVKSPTSPQRAHSPFPFHLTHSVFSTIEMPNGYLPTNFPTLQKLPSSEFQNVDKTIYDEQNLNSGKEYQNNNEYILFCRHKIYKNLNKTYCFTDPCFPQKLILPQRKDKAPMSIEDYEKIKTELEKIDINTLNQSTREKPQAIIKLIEQEIQKLGLKRDENNYRFAKEQFQLFQDLHDKSKQAELSKTGHVLQQDNGFDPARVLYNLQNHTSP